MTKFRHIPAAGRIIIFAVAFGVFAIAAAACATSYNAIFHLVDQLGLYGAGITEIFPGLVDFAFIVGESAAILGGIMRATTRSEEVTKGWPYTAMWVCGLCTIAFNVWHAALIGGLDDPLTVPRCVVAALPPILMMVSFQVLISIVKWVMLHLGRPLNSAAALSPTGYPAPAPGALYPPHAAPYGAFPPGPPGYGPGLYGPPALYGQNPSWAPSQIQQTGQPPEVLDGNGEQAEATKRRQVEAHLAALGSDQLGRLNGLGPRAAARELTAALNGQGVQVSERYVHQIWDDWTAAARQQTNGRRRKH